MEARIKVKLIVISDCNHEVLAELCPGFSTEDMLLLNQPVSYLSRRALLTSLSVVLTVSKFLKRYNITTVLAHAPYAHFIMRMVKLEAVSLSSFNFKLIQYFHITQYKEYPLNSLQRVAINTINQVLAKRYDDAHVSVSNAVMNDIELNLIRHKNHRVIYNALPAANCEQPAKTNEAGSRSSFNILLPGRLEVTKGHFLFLEALKILVQQQHIATESLHLNIVGEGSEKINILRQITDSNLHSYVTVSDAVANLALMRYMGEADLVVVPSLHEGLPLVILEALQMGSLILASDIDPIKEVITDMETGILFRAGNVEDCLQKLLYLYQNRASVAVNRAKVDNRLLVKFSFQQHIKQLLQIIREFSGHTCVIEAQLNPNDCEAD